MCWIGNENDKKIAEQDIPVFKICAASSINENLVFPYYFSHKIKYAENITYNESICFSNGIRPFWDAKRFLTEELFEIAQGLHSYSTELKLTLFKHLQIHGKNNSEVIGKYCQSYARLVLCLIPKGATYYANEDGEYVSDALTISHICHYKIKDDNDNIINCINTLNRLVNNWKYMKYSAL